MTIEKELLDMALAWQKAALEILAKAEKACLAEFGHRELALGLLYSRHASIRPSSHAYSNCTKLHAGNCNLGVSKT
jgi:hypothetical protein